jgi:phosphoacetylglucosamine mutase
MTTTTTPTTTTAASCSSVELILQLLQEHPLQQLEAYSYGTAGFRYKADVMEGCLLRVGIVAAVLLRKGSSSTSSSTSSSSSTRTMDMGVMVTASHNDESYNGVKLSNPDGSMIDDVQERLLVEWVNERSLDKWRAKLVQEWISTSTSTRSTTTSSTSTHATLHVGRDTRSHSPRLAQLVVQGAEAMGARVHDHGTLTTPMLHHVVLHSNADSYLPPSIPPAPTRAGYIHNLAHAYCSLLTTTTSTSSSTSSSSRPDLQVDGACGVGYEATREVIEAIATLMASSTSSPPSTTTTTTTPFQSRIHAWNAPTDGPLNTNCGSEHVQKQLQAPEWYRQTPTDTSYCCSLDGDADRIVFFAQPPSQQQQQQQHNQNQNPNEWILLDGDKISVLIAHVLTQKLEAVYQKLDKDATKRLPKITMGVVQTAYANGASTDYLKVCTALYCTIIYCIVLFCEQPSGDSCCFLLVGWFDTHRPFLTHSYITLLYYSIRFDSIRFDYTL